tara:strand:+ start:19137 stop:19754 length:618 start_codon:yes stop_codon:yes gene_type:complete
MELRMNVLVEHSLTPNEFVYLYYLVNGKMLPITINITLIPLQEKGFIKIMPEGKVQVRQKTINLFKLPITSEEKQITEAVNNSQKLSTTVDQWISEWRDLFPMKIKTGGYPVRGTKQGCIKKMKSFIKANPGVTKEMIFKATKRYLEERRQTGYAYMKMADYFINKDGASMLETYIEIDYLRKQEGKSPLLDEFDPSVNNLTDDI